MCWVVGAGLPLPVARSGLVHQESASAMRTPKVPLHRGLSSRLSQTRNVRSPKGNRKAK